jgi:hypothetical protein
MQALPHFAFRIEEEYLLSASQSPSANLSAGPGGDFEIGRHLRPAVAEMIS